MTQQPTSDEIPLDKAYAACRAIARREAKNFYYAFVALPDAAPQRHLRHLRLHAPGRRSGRRRKLLLAKSAALHLDAWLAAWRGVCAGERDRRSGLPRRARCHRSASPSPSACSMSWSPASPWTSTQIRPGARTGRARHLRHLRRSLSLLLPGGLGRRPGLHSHLRLHRSARRKAGRRNRHRLPAHQHSARRSRGCRAQSRLSSAAKTLRPTMFRSTRCCIAPRARRPQPNERALLADIAQRAEDYYRSAEALLPLIDRESRPALWVLVSIYHALAQAHRARRLRCVFPPRLRAPPRQNSLFWP